jgi:hypothetical protein
MGNGAAIETLEKRLMDLERKGNALVEVINDLRAEDGLPPRSPWGSGSGISSSSSKPGETVSTIRSDTFYGKKLQTAMREYLEMRARQNLGPAKPREIYDAITAGGFQFETQDETVALVGMRAMLRKRTAFFHKLPNSTYGLTAWYPGAKKPKASAAAAPADTEEDEDLAGVQPDTRSADKQTAAPPKGVTAD